MNKNKVQIIRCKKLLHTHTNTIGWQHKKTFINRKRILEKTYKCFPWKSFLNRNRSENKQFLTPDNSSKAIMDIDPVSYECIRKIFIFCELIPAALRIFLSIIEYKNVTFVAKKKQILFNWNMKWCNSTNTSKNT